MAVQELERECNYNGQQSVVKLVHDSDKDLFSVDGLIPLLAVESDEEQSTGDWKSRVLQKFGVLVERDENNNKWISREKTWELLKVLGVQDSFHGDLGLGQDLQTHDTDQDDDDEEEEDEDNAGEEGGGGNFSNGAAIRTNTIRGEELETREFSTDSPLKRAINDHKLGSPLKKLKPAETFNSAEFFTHDLQLSSPLTVQPAKKPLTDFQPDDRVKLEHLLQHILFPDGQSVQFEAALANMGNSYSQTRLNLDIPIDEHGNTALHWLCSIANVRLTKDLIRNGAERLLGDKTGESALVKAVKSVNNYDSGTFEELLDFLYPCLIVVDDMGRTVLHHIVITSGMPGCAAAAKYYLDILMGWIVKKQAREFDGERDIILSTLDLKWFINCVLNARDINGDTCLNIASRLGNVSIVEALLDYGADPRISNNSGLRPVDFGAGATKLEATQSHDADVDRSMAASGPDSTVLINNIQTLINTISQDYDMEIKQHKEQLSKLHADLNDQRKLLTASRDKLAQGRQLRDDHTQLTEQISNIHQAIVEEDADFKKVSGELGIDDESLDMAEFDADEPFRIDFIYDFLEKKLQSEYSGDLKQFLDNASLNSLLSQLMTENSGQEESIPPEGLLRARICAYEKNEHKLNESLQAVREKQAHLEGRFRRVLSLCLKVDEDKVDGMLDGLLQAISTEDPEDIDTDELQTFLSKHTV
ncbi:LANO_0G01640g1_1 [Lachancea nothofagi CBS 11611]|uniref:LANO_0G01640g1_1 n=1 Tax=Lachancea nothofagi CBS 11611 TaxID=1266666 RepID=A0A1G4KF69_9SACH|nr:LANO_0G01640g1_1 [Lachancea nothofagi CBS 11611]